MNKKSFFCEEIGEEFIYQSTRVILNSGGYDANPDDPVADSEYECEGIVTGPAGDEEYPLQVTWDNGHTNQYRTTDLHIIEHLPIQPAVEDNNPNKTFKAHKFRQQREKESKIIPNIRKIIDSLGLSIEDSRKLLMQYNNDADAAITYYNLNKLSAAEDQSNAPNIGGIVIDNVVVERNPSGEVLTHDKWKSMKRRYRTIIEF